MMYQQSRMSKRRHFAGIGGKELWKMITLTHIHISIEENIHDLQFSQEPKDAHTATSSVMLVKLKTHFITKH